MRVRRYTKNRRGAGMVEYGLIVGLVAVVAIVAAEQSGERVSGLMNTVAAELGTVQNNVADAGATGTTGGSSAPQQPSGCNSVGDSCGDGTIYAGEYDGRKLYVMPSDQGTSVAWNDGSEAYDLTGATDLDDGAANTRTLAGEDGDEGPVGNSDYPYEAARMCAAFAHEGLTDWYLPAENELNVLHANKSEIGGFSDNVYYWSSTEASSENARLQKFTINNGDGGQYGFYKWNERHVRCVRSV